MIKILSNHRIVSIISFSFLFAYLLSFLFEGQVLYSLLDNFGVKADTYVIAAISAHFLGLFSCGLLIKTPRAAKRMMAGSLIVCVFAAVPFYFQPSPLWLTGLILAGLAGGWAVAAWGYFLKNCTPKKQRIKTCADVLIYSNLIMIAINVVAMNGSPYAGLALSMFCLVFSAALTLMLPVDQAGVPASADYSGQKTSRGLRMPMLVLFLFVAVITVNSGLMYQVINPGFEHLTGLVSWYWAVPYILSLAVMRNLPMRYKRPLFLYVGMGMIMAAFISFMLLGRGEADYLIVDTLMLGACGIFDLFWWSIIGEMLEYTDNPVKVFGIGLSANVFGVLSGGVLGMGVTSIQLPGAEVTVIALTVVCVTLVILPPLNRQLVMLLKSHAYLTTYEHMNEEQQGLIINQTKILAPLTEREQEVLQLILSGKSNRKIANELFISESTVKTHARNIYSKYDVGSRTELISNLLRNQTGG